MDFFFGIVQSVDRLSSCLLVMTCTSSKREDQHGCYVGVNAKQWKTGCWRLAVVLFQYNICLFASPRIVTGHSNEQSTKCRSASVCGWWSGITDWGLALHLGASYSYSTEADTELLWRGQKTRLPGEPVANDLRLFLDEAYLAYYFSSLQSRKSISFKYELHSRFDSLGSCCSG